MQNSQPSRAPLIGLVVEGTTEYEAVPGILDRLSIRHTTPSNAHGFPSDAAISTAVKTRLLQHVRVQLAKGADKVVVLLDREGRPASPESFQQSVREEIRSHVERLDGRNAAAKVEVAACNSTFENWIISDPKGLMKSAYVDKDLTNQVSCHADDKDALALLKSALRKGKAYNKTLHGPALAEHVRVQDAAVRQCSQSLRRFIELVRAR